MPGEMSRSNRGPRGDTPLVPSWMPPLMCEYCGGPKDDGNFHRGNLNGYGAEILECRKRTPPPTGDEKEKK